MKRILILCVLLMAGCSDSAYDPLLGPRNPGPGAEQYFAGRTDIPEDQKAALLGYQPCSQEFLFQLADAPVREVRSLVAANPSINQAIIEKLINDKDPGVRGYLAGNRNIPRSVLLRLREDSDENVRWMLPGNPNWTEDDIRKMHKENVTSRSVIARNPSAPPDVLEELSTSRDYNIMSALANNPSITKSIVLSLVKQNTPSIRKMIAYNPATPDDVLLSLEEDSDPEVRRYASRSLKRRISRDR